MILASFDLANSTGVCIKDIDYTLTCIDVSKIKNYHKFVYFWEELSKLYELYKFEVAAYERVDFVQHSSGAKYYPGWVALLTLFCHQRDIRLYDVSVTAVKSVAGSGSYNKDMMVYSAQQFLPSFNEKVKGYNKKAIGDMADALHIMRWLERELGTNG